VEGKVGVVACGLQLGQLVSHQRMRKRGGGEQRDMVIGPGRQLTGVHAPPQRQPNMQNLSGVVIIVIGSRQQQADGIGRRVEVAAAVSTRLVWMVGLVPPL